MLVKDIMRKPIVTEKDISLSDAAAFMNSKKIGCLLLLEDGEVSGILTERDVIKNFGKEEKMSDAMTKKIISVTSGVEASEALETMRANEIKRLPVIDKGNLVGIITITDIIEHWSDINGEEEFFF